MLKNNQGTFESIQKLLDLAIVILAWATAYILRFYHFNNAEMGLHWLFLKAAIILAVINLFFFSKFGLYTSHRLKSRSQEVFNIFKAQSFSVLLFIVLLYFFSETRLSRAVIIIYYSLSLFFLILSRMMIRNFLRHLRRQGKNLRHILLVGQSRSLEEYVKLIQSYKDAGIQFMAWIDAPHMSIEFAPTIPRIDLSIDEAKKKYHPDSIVIGYSGDQTSKLETILRNEYNDVVPIHLLPDLTYALVGYQIEDFSGIPILSLNQPNFSPIELGFKRFLDFTLCAIGLLVISPLLILIAIGVKLTSKGPIFFAQERIGLDGKKFKMWKFRSMKVETQASSTPGWTTKDDPRKTAFGTFIRKTSIDELPQLYNVLVGEMSLVGPRPEQPYYVEKFRHEIPAYMLRHKMKAGITGWAQVNGWRGDTSLVRRIECDIYYIRNWSLWLDFKIIFLTFWKGFVNRNAY